MFFGRRQQDGKEDSCQIDNPLRNLDPDTLKRQAEEFAHLVGKDVPDGRVATAFKTVAQWARLSRGPTQARGLETDLTETDEALIVLFRKAAKVAQNPLKLDRLSLSKHEQALLQRDPYVKFWDQPKAMRVTVITLCFSAMTQGWIQSGSNGANLNWPGWFGITDKSGKWDDDAYPHAQLIFAGVNAVTYLAAAVFGCWLSDPLQSRFLGRRGAVFFSALLCFASLIGSACTQNWRQLMVCRALVGLGMGAKASVTPIFGAETAPSHLRGALVMNWQLFDAFGTFLGFTANLVLIHTGQNLSWRLQYASACVPTLCLLVLILVIPESPRWLLKQRRHRKAFKALCSLRETSLQAAVELFYANAQLQVEAKMQPDRQVDKEKTPSIGSSQHVENTDVYKQLNAFQDRFAATNYFSRLLQLFRDPRTRRATIAATVVMISQQLCGVNVIQFYSCTFFRDTSGVMASVDSAGKVQDKAVTALWLSWGIGLANFIFTFPAYFLIDTKGRRWLLLVTYPGMMLSMLGACLSFATSSDISESGEPSHGLSTKVPIFMLLFVFFYSWGQGPVAFTYSSEVFPLINREAGMSFAVFVNLLGAGILTLVVPLAETNGENRLGKDYNHSQAGLLGIFVAFNLLALVLIFIFMPETAGATIRKKDDLLSYMKLEELNYIFEVNTGRHIAYQVQYMIPYAWKKVRYWLCRWFTKKYPKPRTPQKMWVWAEMKEDAKEEEKEPSGSPLDNWSGSRDGCDEGIRPSQRLQRSVVEEASD